jgi:hypothetical protein
MTEANLTDSAGARDEAAHSAAYRGVRERVSELVRSVPADRFDRISPATPEWRVRDVPAHLWGSRRMS